MFLYSSWLDLALSTRAKIAQIFNIVKKGATHVQDNEVVSDGYNVKDIESALTREAMQKYLNSQEQDMDKLFKALVINIENPIKPLDNFVIPKETVPIIQETIKKRLGRPPKIRNAEN
jgi:hypothetical protein